MSSRHHAREQAFQILFQADQRQCPVAEARILYERHLSNGETLGPLCLRLVGAYEAKEHEVNAVIISASDNWRIERMSAVDRTILRLGAAELLYLDEIPSRITLHEAVILAKSYGSETSPAFVNGILDRVAKDVGDKDVAHTETGPTHDDD